MSDKARIENIKLRIEDEYRETIQEGVGCIFLETEEGKKSFISFKFNSEASKTRLCGYDHIDLASDRLDLLSSINKFNGGVLFTVGPHRKNISIRSELFGDF